MKQIRIFSLVLIIVMILALPLNALACDGLKAIRDAAKLTLDAANTELDNTLLAAGLSVIGNNILDRQDEGDDPPTHRPVISPKKVKVKILVDINGDCQPCQQI